MHKSVIATSNASILNGAARRAPAVTAYCEPRSMAFLVAGRFDLNAPDEIGLGPVFGCHSTLHGIVFEYFAESNGDPA